MTPRKSWRQADNWDAHLSQGELLAWGQAHGACEAGLERLSAYAADDMRAWIKSAPEEDTDWLLATWSEALGLSEDREYAIVATATEVGIAPTQSQLESDRHEYLASEARVCGMRMGDVDPYDQPWVLWFGAYGGVKVLVWAPSIEDALEAAAELLPPGMFAEPKYAAYSAAYDATFVLTRFFAATPTEIEVDECERHEWVTSQAEVGLTYTESGHIPSWEWGIVCEGIEECERAVGL